MELYSIKLVKSEDDHISFKFRSHVCCASSTIIASLKNVCGISSRSQVQMIRMPYGVTAWETSGPRRDSASGPRRDSAWSPWRESASSPRGWGDASSGPRGWGDSAASAAAESGSFGSLSQHVGEEPSNPE